jgi:hypothetical protein
MFITINIIIILIFYCLLIIIITINKYNIINNNIIIIINIVFIFLIIIFIITFLPIFMIYNTMIHHSYCYNFASALEFKFLSKSKLLFFRSKKIFF